MTAEPHDPKALLLDKYQVGARLGRKTDWVETARRASDPKSYPKPMPGWVNVGSPNKPDYRISEANLIAYIDRLDPA